MTDIPDAAVRCPESNDRPVVPVYRGGTGPRPGLDLTSNRALTEVLDEGLELDSPEQDILFTR